MNKLENQSPENKNIYIFLALVVAVVTIGLLALVLRAPSESSQSSQNIVKPGTNDTDDDQEERKTLSAVNLLKSHLDMYYRANGGYPSSIETLREHVHENDNEESIDLFGSMLTDIENLDYNVRGDKEAYKFTYNHNGSTETVENKYKEEFN